MRNAMTLAVASALLWASAASAEVRLTMADGLVSLSAKNATVAQILTEWARVGQTRIVNGERIPSAPMTIELTNVPEAQALDIILRSAGGYLLALRSNAVPSASRFDRILIVPVSTATAGGAPSPSTLSPSLPQPRFMPQPPQLDVVDEPDDLDAGGTGAPRGPAFSTFPPPNALGRPNEPPDQGARPVAPAPEAPAGVARPGMLVPMPPTTPQPGAPTTPQPGARSGSPQP